MKNAAVNAGRARGMGLTPGSGRSLEEARQPVPELVPGEFHGQSVLGLQPAGLQSRAGPGR